MCIYISLSPCVCVSCIYYLQYIIIHMTRELIPGGNWARLNEADSDTTALANTMKECSSKGRVGCSWWLSPKYMVIYTNAFYFLDLRYKVGDADTR